MRVLELGFGDSWVGFGGWCLVDGDSLVGVGLGDGLEVMLFCMIPCRILSRVVGSLGMQIVDRQSYQEHNFDLGVVVDLDGCNVQEDYHMDEVDNWVEVEVSEVGRIEGLLDFVG